MDRMSSLRLFLLPLVCLSLGWPIPMGSLSAQDTAPAQAPVAPSADGSTPPPAAAPMEAAPAAPDAAAPAPEAPAAPAAVPAPVPDVAPAPSADEAVARAVPVAPVAPVAKTKFPLPARDPAIQEGDYIGHRYAEPNDSGGWGWIKLPTDSWAKGGRWIALEETPGVASAPWRDMGPNPTRTGDQNYEYKMHGYFATYQVYDPHTNEMLDVFILESYETIGPAQPLSIRSGPEDRHGDLRRSGFSSRPRADDY